MTSGRINKIVHNILSPFNQGRRGIRARILETKRAAASHRSTLIDCIANYCQLVDQSFSVWSCQRQSDMLHRSKLEPVARFTGQANRIIRLKGVGLRLRANDQLRLTSPPFQSKHFSYGVRDKCHLRPTDRLFTLGGMPRQLYHRLANSFCYPHQPEQALWKVGNNTATA